MMWIRVPMAGLASFAVMAGMFGLMYGMVQGTVEGVETVAAKRIEFTRLRQDSEVRTNRAAKPERKQTTVMPNQPKIQVSGAVSNMEPAVAFDNSGVGQGVQISNMSIGSGGFDRDVIPLVRIQPQYPTRAASRGVEGWVRVQFTITPAGAVTDATVTDSEPKGMFDRAALEAVSRWKYNPKVENGTAVERRGVQVLLSFQLEK